MPDGQLNEIAAAHIQAYVVISGFLGLLMLLMGYRVWSLVLFLAGLPTGFFLGLLLAPRVQASPEAAFFVGIVGAIVIAAIFVGVRPLGTFFVAGSIAWGLTETVLLSTSRGLSMSAEELLAATASAGVIGGLVVAVCGRAGIVLASSFSGAQCVVAAGSILLAAGGKLELAVLAPFGPSELVATGVIGLLGAIIQFSSTSGGASTRLQEARAPDGVAARLAELQLARTRGLIKDDEFEARRAKILEEA